MSDVPELPSLTVVGGPIDGYEMKMSPGTTVIIGSGRLAHMRVDHPEIELAHVKVAWDDFGLAMVDNGSRKGTWVNGEGVETASLLDGDVIEFVGPDSKSTPPKIRVKIPKGSVPDPPPLPPPAPGEVARPARPSAPTRVPAARGRSRRRRSVPRLPDARELAFAGLAAVSAVTLALGAKWLFFTAPQVGSIQPAEGEPGQTVTLTGKRFDRDAADNVVWFGDRSANASSISAGTLQAAVPPGVRPGRLEVRVETSAGRSRPVTFTAWAPLRAFSIDPVGALPGDEVALQGSGFDEGTAVTVGGVAAQVKSAEAGTLRFAMPGVQGTPGSLHDVVAAAGGRRTKPLRLYLGHVPLVASLEPARGVAGSLVLIRGAGFAPAAGANAVTFDGVPALVVAASPSVLAVASCSGSSRGPGCRDSWPGRRARAAGRTRRPWAPRSRRRSSSRARTMRGPWESAPFAWRRRSTRRSTGPASAARRRSRAASSRRSESRSPACPTSSCA
jgi:hypothetical protein